MSAGEIVCFLLGILCGAIWMAIAQNIHHNSKASDKPSWHRGRFD